jgi:hypothetical protein
VDTFTRDLFHHYTDSTLCGYDLAVIDENRFEDLAFEDITRMDVRKIQRMVERDVEYFALGNNIFTIISGLGIQDRRREQGTRKKPTNADRPHTATPALTDGASISKLGVRRYLSSRGTSSRAGRLQAAPKKECGTAFRRRSARVGTENRMI